MAGEILTKEKLKDYLKDKFDVIIDQIFIDLKLVANDLPKLEFYLDELIKEGWIKKSSSLDHFEYDPGEKLNYGGII